MIACEISLVFEQANTRVPNTTWQQDWYRLDAQKRLEIGLRQESAQKCNQNAVGDSFKDFHYHIHYL